MRKLELHESRLGTTDAKGRRIMPQPEEVKGKWTSRRHIFQWFLIFIFMVLPWIYVDGSQWVRLDIPKREFTLFGSMFYAHDSVFLIFLLLGFMLLVAFVTSVWGRVWCGWACPQTVFIELVFRKAEEFIEGGARKRKALNKKPWDAEKILKKTLKWVLFTLISLHITHSFLGYFTGTRELLQISLQAPAENWTLFIVMLVLSGIVLFDFGWFREQFCVIACPYGRFQSVMMDENSLVVAYDEKRGEPRRARDLPKDKEGDCIDCFKCVKVCPTGIDIRRGTQMECIACALCIDACDDIMTKVGKPEGLIRYASQKELEGGKRSVWLRSSIFAVLLILVFGAGVYGLNTRGDLDARFLRMPGEPFTVIKTEAGPLYLNRYTLKLDTLGRKGLRVAARIEGTSGQAEFISGELPKIVDKDQVTASFFIRFPRELLSEGKALVPLTIEITDGDRIVETVIEEVKIVGPL